MALSAIFEAVKAEIDVLAPGTSIVMGGEYLQQNAAPPRIVFVPTDDTYRQPEIHEGDGVAYDLPTGARPLIEVSASVEFHIWAASWDDAETLRNAVVVALRRCAAAAFEILRGGWVTPQAAGLQSGRAYVLLVSFPIPVLDAAPLLATVTATDTVDVAFDPHPGP
jgi:hypothetical protein